MDIPRRAPRRRPKKIRVVEEVVPSESDMRMEEAQNRVIASLAAGHSQVAAAESAGIHPSTITRWKKDEEFAAAIARQTEQANKNSQVNTLKLRALGSKAIDVLAVLMDSENEKIRLAAATEVLDRTGHVKAKEVVLSGRPSETDAPATMIEALEVLGMRAEDMIHALPVEAGDGTIEKEGRGEGEGATGDSGEVPGASGGELTRVGERAGTAG